MLATCKFAFSTTIALVVKVSDRMNSSPQVIYTDPAQINQGVALGKQIRDAIQSQDTTGQLNSYVNYAFGDEGLKAVYGYEPWRLEKLRRIKRQYDPRGKFNFFAPITY